MSEVDPLYIAKDQDCEALWAAGAPKGPAASGLLGAENILAIAVTHRLETAGEPASPQLTYFVRRKEENPLKIEPRWNLTQHREDLPTKVEEITELRALAVPCGVAVRAGSGLPGTAGCVVGVPSSTDRYLLSAGHVLQTPKSVLHWNPSPSPSGPAVTWLGTVTTSTALDPKAPNTLDAGLALLDGTLPLQPRLRCAALTLPSKVGHAAVGDLVTKCGAATGGTDGVVTAIDACGWVNFDQIGLGWMFFREQILIGNGSSGAFANFGDSGSIVSRADAAVGLLFAGSPSDGVFLANPLKLALDKLLPGGWKLET